MRRTDRSRATTERRAERGDELRQDLRFALRQLSRNRGFTAIALVTLALGIGANTAIFSVVRGVLLRDLPYTAADRLIRIYSTSDGAPSSVSPADFHDWREQTTTFASLAASYEGTVNLTGNGSPERYSHAAVSADLFDLLGVRPAIGRAFLPGEDAIGAPRVAMLSDGLWRRRFGADPSVIGTSITLDGHPTVVVGVAPPDLHYPATVDLWFPTRFDAQDLSDANRGARWIQVIGRLADGTTREQAASEMATIAKRLEERDPRHNTGYGVMLVALHDDIVGPVRTPLVVLLSAVGLVLLIACANVASLMLGRTAARESEMAVRTALGAGRGRLVRQMLTESAVLALLGGMLGLTLATLGARALVAIAPDDIPRLYDVRVDGVVLLFTLGATLLAAVVFGSVPAVHASPSGIALHLREGNRGSRTRPGSARARGALVVAEITLALMLLAGAGLLLKSFARLRDVNPGFDPARVATFTVTLPSVQYARIEEQRAFGDRLLAEVERIPSVERAAMTFGLPFSGSSFVISFTVDGRSAAALNDEPVAQIRTATPGYFATMGIPLVRGRAFTAFDRADAPRALIISEETARRFFAGEDPIGKQLVFGWGRDGEQLTGEIVGIVGDVLQRGLSGERTPHAYVPFDQWPIERITVVMRSRGDPAVTLREARAAVTALDRDLPVYDAVTLSSMVDRSLGQPRFYLLLLAVFATVAVVLAAVGIYGVMAYTVQQRTREIGIRIALGASADRVVRMMVRRGLLLGTLGVALGTLGAMVMTRLLRSLLFGVSARDPLTFAGVATMLGGVTLLASWIAARRAARVDPLAAMRAEG